MCFLRQTLLSVCLILSCAIAMAQPTVANDAANGDEDEDIIISILDNDSPGGSAIDPTSVDLVPGGSIDASVVVPEGTFTVDPGVVVLSSTAIGESFTGSTFTAIVAGGVDT